MSPHRRFICLQVAAKGSPHFAAGRHGMAGTALVCVDIIGKLRSAKVLVPLLARIALARTNSKQSATIGRGRISKIAFGLITSNRFEP